MRNKIEVTPINYDAVVETVRKRCVQVGITEDQLLEQLPASSLREAVDDIRSIFIIGQVLNYEIDSMYECDLPMEREKLDAIKAALAPYTDSEKMERFFGQLIRDAERMGRMRFIAKAEKICGKIKRRLIGK